MNFTFISVLFYNLAFQGLVKKPAFFWMVRNNERKYKYKL